MIEQDSQEVEVWRNIKIPLRDGCHLNANIYLPRGKDSPSPTIVSLTPYISDRLHDRGMYFAGRNLPFVGVDVRGRGNSEGNFRPYIYDSDDGCDVVCWVARQGFCNGKVAMYGASYLGYVQWVVAARLPEPLCAIAPTAAPFLGVDVPMRNNIFPMYAIRWLATVAERAMQPKLFADSHFWSTLYRRQFETGRPFGALDKLAGEPSSIFQEWIAHPEQGPYWDALNPSRRDYEDLQLPILTITGAYDGDQLGALEHYKKHMQSATPTARERHYLVIGPWDHAGCAAPRREFGGIKLGPDSVIDILDLHLQWYLWIFGTAAKPEFLKDRVAYYVMGAEHWRYASTLEEVTARVASLYLHADGNPTDVFRSGLLVGEVSQGGEPDHYIYDPRDVNRAGFESMLDDERSLTDQSMIHALFGQCFVYHSLPFDEDTEVSGFFRFSAWISIDCRDTDFRVSLYEIGIDGTSTFLTADWMRARYRRSLRQAHLIQNSEPLQYDFERFPFVSRLIRKGHRVRMVFDSKDSIHEQRNYNRGEVVAEESIHDALPVTIRLFHDLEHPSVLYVPIGRGEATITVRESLTSTERE